MFILGPNNNDISQINKCVHKTIIWEQLMACEKVSGSLTTPTLKLDSCRYTT